MWDRLIHKYLKIPYILHVHEFRSPKHARATVLLIHGIGASWKTWEQTAANLPKDIRVIAVDLLGFGASPKPSWKAYDVKDQTDSIITTLLRRGLFGPVIIVGHSLGALVAVEMARRYPLTVRSLILVSPPFYRPQAVEKFYYPEKSLRRLYQIAIDNPGNSAKILRLAAKRKLWPDPGYTMDEAGTLTFLATLNAAIVNQQSITHAEKLKQNTKIIYGKLDPLVIESNLKSIAKHNPRISLQPVSYATHEIRDALLTNILTATKDAVDDHR